MPRRHKMCAMTPALSGDEVVGCASYDPAPGDQAEIAFAVADRMHGSDATTG
jgi:hypothetical protein